MQNRFQLSELEMRGPRNSLNTGPRSSEGMHSAQFLVPTLDLRTEAGIGEVRGREIASVASSWHARAQQ
eukprot:8148861-Alexandrium_andersonii.AAC.1